jgi:hypothetical protein
MIHTKNRRGVRRQCVGPIKYKYNFLSRYIINIFLYQNKSTVDSEINCIYYRDRAFYWLWRSPGSAICPFGTGRLEERGQGAALENEESRVMGRCLSEHAADER